MYKMHKNERIIIDARTYVMDEIFERYKREMLIFCKKGLTLKAHENKRQSGRIFENTGNGI